MKVLLKDIWEGFLDLLYPEGINCYLCGGKIRGQHRYGVCQSCSQSITFIGSRSCKNCGKYLAGGGLCSDCRSFSHFFDRAYSLCVYDDRAKESIYFFKYTGRSCLARPFGRMMADRIREIGLDRVVDIIVPVPLHPGKQRLRGYNQSRLLAKTIARELKGKAVMDILVRQKNTPPLSGLTRIQRAKALEGAFELKNKQELALKNILLIDDIYTTGTTVNQCSKALKEKGADKVYVFTLSSGRDI
jgi:ComF family protein